MPGKAGESRVGCSGSPPALTTDGNADRVRGLSVFSKVFQGGLQSENFADGWVAMPDDARSMGIMTAVAEFLRGVEHMGNPKGKTKFLWWAYPSTLEKVKSYYRKDNCQSQSEFIERAVNYYVGHLDAEDTSSYLPNALLSNMKSITAESNNKVNRMLFKLSVELSMMMNLFAAFNNVDSDSLTALRGECVKEVKRLNGAFSFDDAVDWQKG